MERLTLRAWRRRKMLSQEDLERLSGVKQNTIWRIETGKVTPRPSTLRRLCEALGIAPEQLDWERDGEGDEGRRAA